MPPGCYNMVYMPRCCNSLKNLGLAFINFPSTELAKLCITRLQTSPLFVRGKTLALCRPAWAYVQGVGASIALFVTKNSAGALSRKDAPLFFLNGAQISYQAAFRIYVDAQMLIEARLQNQSERPFLEVANWQCINQHVEGTLRHVPLSTESAIILSHHVIELWRLACQMLMVTGCIRWSCGVPIQELFLF